MMMTVMAEIESERAPSDAEVSTGVGNDASAKQGNLARGGDSGTREQCCGAVAQTAGVAHVRASPIGAFRGSVVGQERLNWRCRGESLNFKIGINGSLNYRCTIPKTFEILKF